MTSYSGYIELWPNSKLKFTSFAHLHLTNNWASSFGKSPIKYSNDMVFFIPRGLGYFLSSVPSLGLDSGKKIARASPLVSLTIFWSLPFKFRANFLRALCNYRSPFKLEKSVDVMQDLISFLLNSTIIHSFLSFVDPWVANRKVNRLLGVKKLFGVSWPFLSRSDDSNFNECFSTRHSVC